MSVLVAVRKEGVAAIAGDTQVSQGSIFVPGKIRCYPPKVHNIAGAYIGVVGSIAHHSVLRSLSTFRPELFRLDSGDEIFETFRRIYPLLRDEYHLLTEKDHDDQEYESSQMYGLVISKAGLFSFSSSRDVSEYTCFWAAGSGMELALGALEATYASDQSALSIAENAVAVACKYDSSCGLPLESYELPLR